LILQGISLHYQSGKLSIISYNISTGRCLNLFAGGHIIMSASFEELTGAVDRLLHTLQYGRHTIAVYHRFWNRLSEFMAHEGILEFNRECGKRYYSQTYGITLSEPSKNCPWDSRHCHRAITVLLDYQNSGTIYRRRLSKGQTDLRGKIY